MPYIIKMSQQNQTSNTYFIRQNLKSTVSALKRNDKDVRKFVERKECQNFIDKLRQVPGEIFKPLKIK